MNVTIPEDNIFRMRPFVAAWFIDNSAGYVLAGATLIDGPPFSGGGKLFRAAFICVLSGFSYLKIESPDFRDPIGLDIQCSSTDGSFSTPIRGDITGALGRPDGKVDVYDISYVARRFGIFPTNPLWDAHADVNSDEKMDIKDVSIVARNFGKHMP